MVLRNKFDNALVDCAKDNGAIFKDETKVKNILKSNDKISVLLNDGNEINAKIVIGADGYLSQVARKIGLNNFCEWIGTCIYEEFKIDSDIVRSFFSEKNDFHIHLKYDDLSGYAWVFPKKSSVNIGIGQFYKINSDKKIKNNLWDVYFSYLSFLKNKKIIPKNLKSKYAKGGIVPIFPIKKTYADRVMICGDAAGFANPISGEGIFYAISSGKMAAETALKSLEQDNTNSTFLSQYEKKWKKDFEMNFKLLKNSTNLWDIIGENLMKIIDYDQYLGNLIFQVLVGQSNLYDMKLKIFQRYLYSKMKYSIKKSIYK